AFSFVTDNAGRVDSEGLEVDFAYLPTSVEGLTVSGSLAWDQSEFDEFTNAETGVVLDGRRLGQSPEWSGTLGAEYFRPLAGTGWDLTLSYLLSYSGDYFVENSRLIDYQQDAFTTHDLALRLGHQNWEFTLAGVNLTDEIYAVFGNISPGVNRQDAEADLAIQENVGRLVTASVSYRF
ncbi:MAG: TonB-dependent receptor, partial [Pseudomonadota bacterium]